MSMKGRPEGESRSAQREGDPIAGVRPPAIDQAARTALQQHLRRQVRGVVALILVLSAALAALSLVPDARQEIIERTPAPATTATNGGLAPGPATPTKDDAGAPSATPPTGNPATTAATAPAPADASAGPAAPGAPTEVAAKASASDAAPTSPPVATPVASTASAPSPAGTAVTPAAQSAGPKADDAPSGPRHYVTLGTFAQPAIAEALRARLDAQGIPAVLEARLRVGPFATREEAQAAQARLKELGFAPGAVISPKR